MSQKVPDHSVKIDVVLNVLLNANYCSSKIAEKSSLSRAWCSAILTKLIENNKIHICDWELVPPRNVCSRAVYKLGSGTNKKFVNKPRHAAKKPLHYKELNAIVVKVERCMYVAAIFGPTALATNINYS